MDHQVFGTSSDADPFPFLSRLLDETIARLSIVSDRVVRFFLCYIIRNLTKRIDRNST